MAIQSGNRLTPARLNAVRGHGQLSSLYTLTTTATDLTGTSFSLTAPTTGAVMYASWSGDFSLVTAGTITGVVQLLVDGVAVTSPQALWSPANVVAGARASCAASYSTTLSAGSHTFKLQASAVITSGSARLNALHTHLTVLVLP